MDKKVDSIVSCISFSTTIWPTTSHRGVSQASNGVALSVNCSLLSKLFSRAYTESLIYISTESMLNKTIGVETKSN
jgi:hypothetical protein